MTWITRLLSEPAALALGWTLLHFIWQGLLVLLLLLAALRLLRDRSAQARYGATCGALATMMALPLVTLTYLSRQTRVERSSTAVRADAYVSGLQSPTEPLAPSAVMNIAGRHAPATVVSAVPAARRLGWTPARIEAVLPVLTGVWCLGVLALSMRMVRQWIAAQRLKRRDTRKLESTWEQKLSELARRLRIRRTVALLESARASVPVVIGWLRPVILLPASALTELTPAQLEALLAHELAHIRRHDYAVNLFQVLVETLLFYHPAVWWVSGRIRIEREHCCDDMAVTFCGDAPLYARALARLEELRRAAPQMVLAASGGTLLHRIRRLISGRSARPDRLTGWPAFALVASVIICVGLGVHFAHSVRGAQTKPAPEADAGMFQPIPRTEPTSSVTGLVTDEDGRPVPDAVVQAILRTGDEDLGQRRTQRTNSDGRFTFDNLDPPGVWFVTADHPEFARDWERERGLLVPEQSQAWPLRIKLYRPHSMSGVVMNENGEAVSGVTVTLAREWLPGNSSPVQGWLAFDVQKTTTDREGRFELKRLRPGKLMLVLEHSDYALTFSEQLEVGAEPVRLTIRRGLELHGRVLTNAAPLAGVSVKIQAPNLAHRSLGQWEVKTDEHGEFTVRHIVDRFEMNGPGVNTVSALVDDGTWKSPVYQIFQLDATTLPAVDIAVQRAEAQVEPKMVQVGRRESAPPGNPHQPVGNGTIRVQFEGATIEADGRVRTVNVHRFNDVQQPVWRELPLSAEGVAVFDQLPPGSYVVDTRNYENPVYPRRSVQLEDGRSVEVSLTKGPATLRGTVRAGGEPIADAYVRCEVLGSAPPGTIEQFDGTAASDGTYEIDGLPPGDYRVQVQMPRSILNSFDVHIASGDNRFDADLPGGRIEGRVFAPPHLASDTLVIVSSRTRPNFGAPGTAVRAAEDGTFFVRFLPEGTYTLFADTGAERLRATATVGPDSPTINLELRPPEHPGWIQGSVSIAGGGTPDFDPNSVVMSAVAKDEWGYDFGSRYRGTLQPGEWNYRVTDLPPGTYSLYVRRGLEGPIVWIPEVEVRADLARKLDIQVPPGRKVLIRFDYAGRHPKRAVWKLRMPSGDWFPGPLLTGNTGASLTTPAIPFALPLGTYTLQADFGEAGSVTRELSVVAGEGVQEFIIEMP